jgi:SAM-dependent methyltransferase
MNPPVDKRPRELRPCPVCDGRRRDRLYRQRFAGGDGGGVALLDGYDVVVCRHCGFAFADGVPTQAEFDAYYRELSKYEYQHRSGRAPDWILDRCRGMVEIMRPFIPSPEARILDIGCATGALLGVIKECGFPNVLGIDPAPACAEAAERLYGVRVLTRSLFDLTSLGQTFDVAILTGVLEHVRDLRPALAQVAAVLPPGGVVYVEVPDATGFVDCPNAPFQEFSVEHVNFFSEASLANLMGVHGFSQALHRREMRELSRQALEPAVCSLFRKDRPPSTDFERDTETEPALAAYVRHGEAIDERVRRIIGELADSGRPVLVWGTGSHTLRLLATSRLSQANVRAYVDSNPRYHGKQLGGVPIIAPEELRRRTEPILISSWVYQGEIATQIREQLAPDAELILLYEKELGAGTLPR